MEGDNVMDTGIEMDYFAFLDQKKEPLTIYYYAALLYYMTVYPLVFDQVIVAMMLLTNSFFGYHVVSNYDFTNAILIPVSAP